MFTVLCLASKYPVNVGSSLVTGLFPFWAFLPALVRALLYMINVGLNV